MATKAEQQIIPPRILLDCFKISARRDMGNIKSGTAVFNDDIRNIQKAAITTATHAHWTTISREPNIEQSVSFLF
jgi:hypothetical protein